MRPADRERGLASINDARRTRRRAVVFGRVRLREVATRFWLFTFAGLAVFGVVYYWHEQGVLQAKRAELRARERAVALVMGEAGISLRDQLEQWLQALATQPPVEKVSSAASLDSISRGPGIYVRLAQSDALQIATLRRAASKSLHDGFTSCLFVARSSTPSVGPPCKNKTQCGAGELCDDWGTCSVPSQPYNLRLLYDALRVVGPEWDERLAKTGDELEVRAMELELDDTSKHEVVAAVEMVRRSKYFTALIDETEGSEKAQPGADAGAAGTAEQRLQARDHFVRVGIWDLERREQLLSMRFEAAGRFVAMGERVLRDAATEQARQRQATNCAAALEVREAIGAATGSDPVAASSSAPALE
ncbi:MAG TPA: hypothetical protein VG963_01605 [Polyangiaceae bacterium]|nr:hypothetical protein [Polyangiaceae bacterium]